MTARQANGSSSSRQQGLRSLHRVARLRCCEGWCRCRLLLTTAVPCCRLLSPNMSAVQPPPRSASSRRPTTAAPSWQPLPRWLQRRPSPQDLSCGDAKKKNTYSSFSLFLFNVIFLQRYFCSTLFLKKCMLSTNAKLQIIFSNEQKRRFFLYIEFLQRLIITSRFALVVF